MARKERDNHIRDKHSGDNYKYTEDKYPGILFGVKINIHGKYASDDDLRKQDGQIIYLIHLVPYTLLT